MRTADDKFVSGARVESMSLIIAATDLPLRIDKACKASMNSGSSVTLVWWPDNDTDNFFIL